MKDARETLKNSAGRMKATWEMKISSISAIFIKG